MGLSDETDMDPSSETDKTDFSLGLEAKNRLDKLSPILSELSISRVRTPALSLDGQAYTLKQIEVPQGEDRWLIIEKEQGNRFEAGYREDTEQLIYYLSANSNLYLAIKEGFTEIKEKEELDFLSKLLKEGRLAQTFPNTN